MTVNQRTRKRAGTAVAPPDEPTARAVADQVVAGRPRRGYVPQLDGLRAVAIVLVVVHHALTPLPFGGLVGVDVFFVLSGYLITGLLLTEHARTGRVSLRRFYLRRLIRLYPPLLVTVFVLFVPGLLLARHRLYYLVDVGGALTYLTPLLVEFNDGASIIFRHTWSLGLEEMFYLVWPLVLILLLRTARSRAVIVGGAVTLGVAILTAGIVESADGSPMSYLTRAGGLFLGCALSALLHGKATRSSPLLGWTGAAVLAAAVALATTANGEGVAVLATCCAALALTGYLAQGNGRGVLDRLLAAPPVAYIGRISYELYLWHFPIFMLVSRASGKPFVSIAWLCVPLSLGLAALTHALLTPLSDRWKARASARVETFVPQGGGSS